ncbi:MAG: DnaB-like helicase C-terminal domain-containing protein [Nocardioidaceae bacterium]
MDDQLRAMADVLSEADAKLHEGMNAAARVWPTGFETLDTYLSGGLRSGELTLLGGPQGLGKTTFALQVLRHAAASGEAVIYFSYEHDASTVLERIIAIEAAEHAGLEAVSLRRIRESLEASDGRQGGLAERLRNTVGGAEAVDALGTYADRLLVHRSSGAETSVDTVRQMVDRTRASTGKSPLVVIDYLQKVFVPGGSELEEERVTKIVEGLKDLALEIEVPVLAIVAADKEGLIAGRRLRVHNLRGSSALAYEADIVLIMNDKYDVVARHHLVYDVGNAERFRNWVVVTIEKNRSGMDKIDLEFRKRFEQGRFEIAGNAVAEQLVDERVFVE